MKIFKSENLLIFLIVFAIAAVAGYYLSFQLKIIFGDALVRSFHAYLVFFNKESPKLSAIGFVWPPLQTLLQLPLVLITPLNTHGFAANILSSLFFGITAIYINLLAKFFKVNKFFRYIILFLFITNPLIFFYGINGMSEMIGICFIIATLYYFLQYITSKSIPFLILTSIALSCATMTRWETGLLLFVVLFIIGLMPFLNKKYSFREVESSIVLLAVPLIFVVLLWLVTSWLIVGSPIYFLHSAYSFTEQDAKNLAVNSLVGGLKGNLKLSLEFVFKRIVLLSPLFIPFFILILSKLKNKKEVLYGLTFLGFAICIIFSQTVPIFLGKSYGQIRYFIYIIPLCFIFLLALFKDTIGISIKKYAKTILFLALTFIILTSSASTLYAMSELNGIGSEERALSDILLRNEKYINRAFENEEKIANYITANIHARSVLVDDSMGFNIVYITKKPNLFIETVDSDFKLTLKNPINSKAGYMLITNPETTSGIDIVSLTYPEMFKGGEDFVTLEKDFGDWRLYRIKTPGEKAAEPTETIKTKNDCKHLVVSGESLWEIAKKDFGNGLIYKEIFEQNKDRLINPSLIQPGENIIIPCMEDL